MSESATLPDTEISPPQRAAQPDPAVANEPTVIDMAVLDGVDNYKHTIKLLELSGVIKGDENIAMLLTMKRINHAAFGDYNTGSSVTDKTDQQKIAALQEQFRADMQAMPFDQLVEQGKIQDLLTQYLTILTKSAQNRILDLDSKKQTMDPTCFNECHKKEEDKFKKYARDLKYYTENPQVVKDAALRFKPMIEQGKYLSVGRIVAQSGLVSSSQTFADDLVNDVLARAGARGIKRMADWLPKEEYMQLYRGNPSEYTTQINAATQRIKQETTSLEALPDVAQGFPELDRIMALKALLSVQLHQASKQEQEPAQRVNLLFKARKLMRSYAEVAQSLTYHYLSEGAASQDKRAHDLQQHLKAEMQRDDMTILPLKGEQGALAKAAELARDSAQDILQYAGDNPLLVAKINTLAIAAGVPVTKAPLKEKSQLIGTGTVLEHIRDLVRTLAEQVGIPLPGTPVPITARMADGGYAKAIAEQKKAIASTPTIAV